MKDMLISDQEISTAPFVTLEELKEYLSGLLPKVGKEKELLEAEQVRIDTLLDVYLWAKEKSEKC